MQIARVATLLASVALLTACGGAPPPEAAAPPSATASPASGAGAASVDQVPQSSPDISGAPTTPPSGATSGPDSGATAPSSAAVAPGGASADKSAVDKNPLTGKISQQTISDLVTKHQELFNDCYTIGAAGSKQFVAVVTIKASIGPTGAVNATQVTKSTAKNPKVDKCVADAFKKMAFPATGSTVPITFPMSFEGAQQISQ